MKQNGKKHQRINTSRPGPPPPPGYGMPPPNWGQAYSATRPPKTKKVSPLRNYKKGYYGVKK